MRLLIATLTVIVACMVAFGFLCRKTCLSTDEQERDMCRKLGGGTLFTIVVLMVIAVVLSCSATPSAAQADTMAQAVSLPYDSVKQTQDIQRVAPPSSYDKMYDDANEEYFRPLLAPYDNSEAFSVMSEHTLLTPPDVYPRLR